MFEFSVARKYLLPQWRQLSVSIISLISVVVISLVVWLIVLFFSVTDGLEKNWIDKLVALTAPVRVTPTEAYYNSYYYQIDSVSAESDYSYKSVGEKLAATISDPYDPEVDVELPENWNPADRDENGNLRDPVKLAFQAVEGINGTSASDFEITYGNIRLRMLRGHSGEYNGHYQEYQSTINQSAYLGSFDGQNPRLTGSLQPLSMKDLSNILHQAAYSTDRATETDPDDYNPVDRDVFQRRARNFFEHVRVKELAVRDSGWIIPWGLLPNEGELTAIALMDGRRIRRLVIPTEKSEINPLVERLQKEGFALKKGQIQLGDSLSFNGEPLRPRLPIVLQAGTTMKAQLSEPSLSDARGEEQIRFDVAFNIQSLAVSGSVPYGTLAIHTADLSEHFDSTPDALPAWAYRVTADTKELSELPRNVDFGEPILLARGYRNQGMLIGDRGYLSYYAPTATSVQEQRLPVYVAGFYDPGIMPMGGKFVFVNRELASLVRGSYESNEGSLSNGINVWVDDLKDAERVKAKLQKTFAAEGIDKYWKVETYREYDFTRDLIRQLQSERNVFTLIAIIIIVVACSNIISMLIILVNDKRLEIGILRAMGASARSIGTIFGACGMCIGLLGGIIGTTAAVITLKNLEGLVDIISAAQGYDAFNTMFYGDTLPNDLSFRALCFVLGATLLISLLAGIIPAIKAARMRPSAILRSE